MGTVAGRRTGSWGSEVRLGLFAQPDSNQTRLHGLTHESGQFSFQRSQVDGTRKRLREDLDRDGGVVAIAVESAFDNHLQLPSERIEQGRDDGGWDARVNVQRLAVQIATLRQTRPQRPIC
jgi:hypothetical protein